MFDIINRSTSIIFRKRSLEKSKSLETKLSRCLTSFQLFFYSVSVMAGAGIYILAGHVVKNRAGPSTNLSFLIGGLSAFFTGLCYCELATLMPQAGSCYTYTYVMIGELPAFIIAWTVIMDCVITLSSVAKGFSGVVNLASNDLIGNFTRTYLPLAPNSDVWDSSADVMAALLIFTLFLITITGANLSFHFNSVLQIIQIICLLTVTAAFFTYGSVSNYVADGGYMPFGISGIIQGAGIAVFAYSGFECIANCAEEMKYPKKSIPIALFTSLGFVIIVYFTVITGLSFMVPRLQIDDRAPFVAAFENKNLDAFKWIAIVGTLIATGATKLSVTYIIGRVVYAVAKDGLIFRFLGTVNETTKVPITALFVGCIFSIIFALFVRIETLADVTSMGILISFIMVGIDLIILRYLFGKDTKENDEPELMKTRIPVHQMLTSQTTFRLVLVTLIGSILFLEISVIFILKFHFILGVFCGLLMLGFAVFSFTILCLYEPNKQDDSFQTPLMPVAPIIAIAVNVGLLLSLPAQTWIRFVVWLLVGLIVYFGYGIRHSIEDDNYIDISSENLKLEQIDDEKKLLRDKTL